MQQKVGEPSAADSREPSPFQARVWDLVELTRDAETGEYKWDWVDVSLATLIVLNVLAVVLQSVRALDLRYHTAFVAFEVFSVVVFTLEYITRIWACTADERYREPFHGRLRYATSLFGVIDLLAILPFYLALLLPVRVIDLRFLRAFRLTRFARLLKIGRYSEASERLVNVYRSKRSDLAVVLVAVAILLVLASALMYDAEGAAQPDKFSSIPAAMWWSISTLTTVGYGDVTPVTTLGKVLGGLIDLLGIALFALPAGILAAGYQEETRRQRFRNNVCPTCGRVIAEHEDGET